MFADLHQLSHHHAWRRQLERLLESAGEGIYGIDLRGRCIFINRTGAAMLGYSPDELIGRNMHYLIHHSHADASLMPVQECRIFQAFREGHGIRVDDEVLWRRDGSAFAAEYASYPIRDAEQGPTVLGAVVTFSDISARKQAEAALRTAHQELERRVAERTAELESAGAALRESHRALQELTAHLDRVREDERRRVARDIHDELGASLTALQLELSWLRTRVHDEASQARLAEMTGIATTAMDALRRILDDLRPGVLDHLGLWSALESLLTEFQRRSGLLCRFDCAAGLDGLRLAPETETALFRIAQEVLTNILRHAEASRVMLRAAMRGSRLELLIEDDGKGMDPARPARGFGLPGMRERARAIGADLRIDSAPGRGTRVKLSLTRTPA